MNEKLIFVYEPNGLQNARMKISRQQTSRIHTNSFTYISPDAIDPFITVPQLIVLEDEAIYQIELVEAALDIDEIDTILVCDNLLVLDKLIDKLQAAPLIITLDYKIGSNSSPENLPNIYKKLRERFPATAIIGYTNFGRKKADKEFSARSADELTDLIRSNGDAVIEKTGMTHQALSSVLYDRMQVQHLRKQILYLSAENSQLKKENTKREAIYASQIESYRESNTMRNLDRPLIGNSHAIKAIKFYIERYGDSDLEVLINGEMGTGKELVARALHRLSPRKSHLFVPVDCGAISAGIAESELFGYEPGAFTGANNRRIGYIEEANKGTLFLDEIGNLPYDLQSKLLRALQEKEIKRLGSSKIISVDFRLICATNKNLKQMVADGKFYPDLLERIQSAFPKMPPLRDRTDDIPLLVNSFIKRYGYKFKLSDEAITGLTNYNWPGNVRELERFVRHLSPFFKDGTVEAHDAKLHLAALNENEVKVEYLEETEKWLDRINFIVGSNPSYTESKKINLDMLAKELGISRNSFFEQRRKYSPAIDRLLNDSPRRWPAIRDKHIKLTIHNQNQM